MVDVCAWVLSHFSCVRLCNPTDCSLPGSSVHGNLQARIQEWMVIPFSRGPSQPRDQTAALAGGFFTTSAIHSNIHFYCYITNYHKFRSSKQYKLIISQSFSEGQRSKHGMTGFSSYGSHLAEISVGEAAVVSRSVWFFSRHTGCWQNSFPCDWRTEVTIYPQAFCHMTPIGSSHMAFCFLPNPDLKVHMIRSGPPR